MLKAAPRDSRRRRADPMRNLASQTKWIHGWKRNGWRTADKKPVKNAELWQELEDQITRHQVHWEWVKGHAGDPGNERADQLALASLKEGAFSLVKWRRIRDSNS